MAWPDDFLAELDRLGEEVVRRKQLRTEFGTMNDARYCIVESWLRSKVEERADARMEEAISLSREAVSLSRDANSISRNALSISDRTHSISIIAIVLSTITTISAAIIGTIMAYLLTKP